MRNQPQIPAKRASGAELYATNEELLGGKRREFGFLTALTCDVKTTSNVYWPYVTTYRGDTDLPSVKIEW